MYLPATCILIQELLAPSIFAANILLILYTTLLPSLLLSIVAMLLVAVALTVLPSILVGFLIFAILFF